MPRIVAGLPAAAVALATAAVVLTGCSSGSTGSAGPSGAGSSGAASPGPAMMTMPDGSVMRADSMAPATDVPTGAPGTEHASDAAATGPSAPARMVCSAEVRGDLSKELAGAAVPVGAATWRHGLYTCTYRLPWGRLVLSVKDLPDTARTAAWLDRRHRALPTAHDAPGLTVGAFATDDGRVVLSKDEHVLTVDARGLPAQFGRQGERRGDFAYETASVILGCWTGD